MAQQKIIMRFHGGPKDGGWQKVSTLNVNIKKVLVLPLDAYQGYYYSTDGSVIKKGVLNVPMVHTYQFRDFTSSDFQIVQ